MELYKAIYRDTNFVFAQQTIDFVVRTVRQYGLDGVCICFNGGKDCTVQLHLLVAAQAFYCKEENMELQDSVIPIPVVYFKVDREFEELEEFNRDIGRQYGFRLVEFDGRDMKQCLTAMQEQYPLIKAIFMGQRFGDPGSAYQQEIQVSDPSWPPITRINPLQRWSYAQVWKFLIGFRLPYCKLYELGYTSLGDAEHTLPNPHQQKHQITLPDQNKLPVTSIQGDASLNGQETLAHQYEGVQKAIEYVANTQGYSTATRCCEHTIFQSQTPPPSPSPHIDTGVVELEPGYNRNTEHGQLHVHTHIQARDPKQTICLCTWPYYPAYMQKDGSKERDGRIKKKKTT